MGARLLDPGEVDAIARLAFEPHGRVQIAAMGQSCVGFLVDASVVDDPRSLAEAARRDVLALARLARMPARAGASG